MNILIISDIHANLTALQAVLAEADGAWDEVWCLGDVIGYGPDPNECTAVLRDFGDKLSVALTGNHDQACLGRVDLTDFNPIARGAAERTQAILTDETRAWLQDKEAKTTRYPFTVAHGSPSDPIWEYVMSTTSAIQNFAAFTTPFCLVGHTHYPCIFAEGEWYTATLHEADYDQLITLDEKKRMIINPGSVGQPRDGNPDAAYALLDTAALTWKFCRVPYDIEATQTRMREQNAHLALIERLKEGY